MSRNRMLGVIGGVLIAISVFFSGNTATFTAGALSDKMDLVLFIAGILVIVFMVLTNRQFAAYATIAALTIWLIMVLSGLAGLTAEFVVLTVGIILAFIASVVGNR
ncbi:MAG: hypothetical protein CVT64_11350 [Actinobacteria bacterium HGW-Actinobacteria-4]|nr:MAG: hypothetical protein CVT64_11350 [Actinobacteria bacterium HGW-Actinobacteria-4]